MRRILKIVNLLKKAKAKKKNDTLKNLVSSQKQRINEQDKDILALLEAVTILQDEVALLKSKINENENIEHFVIQQREI